MPGVVTSKTGIDSYIELNIVENATGEVSATEVATSLLNINASMLNRSTDLVSQTDAEAGTGTGAKAWSPQRIQQAVDKLARRITDNQNPETFVSVASANLQASIAGVSFLNMAYDATNIAHFGSIGNKLAGAALEFTIQKSGQMVAENTLIADYRVVSSRPEFKAGDVGASGGGTLLSVLDASNTIFVNALTARLGVSGSGNSTNVLVDDANQRITLQAGNILFDGLGTNGTYDQALVFNPTTKEVKYRSLSSISGTSVWGNQGFFAKTAGLTSENPAPSGYVIQATADNQADNSRASFASIYRNDSNGGPVVTIGNEAAVTGAYPLNDPYIEINADYRHLTLNPGIVGELRIQNLSVDNTKDQVVVLDPSSNGRAYLRDADSIGGVITQALVIPASKETEDVTTGVVYTWRMPYAFNLTAVKASATVAPVGADLQIQLTHNGANVLSTVLSIDAGETTSTTANTAAVIGTSSLLNDAEMKVVINQVGSTTAGSGVKVTLIGTVAGTNVQALVIPTGQESEDLTVGTKFTFRMPYAFTLSDVKASVTEGPSGGNITLQATHNGTNILSTVATIEDGETSSETAATQPVLSITNLSDDAEIKVIIQSVGTTAPGRGAKLTFIGNPT